MIMDHPKNRCIVPGWLWMSLAGPTIWYLYFWVDYLAAGEGCPANIAALVTWVTIGLTGASMIAIAYYAQAGSGSRGRRDSGDSLVGVSLLVGVFFVVATLFVGVPALMLQPC